MVKKKETIRRGDEADIYQKAKQIVKNELNKNLKSRFSQMMICDFFVSFSVYMISMDTTSSSLGKVSQVFKENI
jgi:hypothetical protein